jgi:drug/metabolite transporter (DMT)-like permease
MWRCWFMLTLAAGLSWACGNIFNKLIMQHEARPPVMSLVVWSALIPSFRLWWHQLFLMARP